MNKKTICGILILLIGLFIIGCNDIIKDDNISNGNTNNNVGITFTAAGNFPFNQGNGTIYSDIYDIAYGNGKFVAVGIAGQIAYSTDGSTWTKVTNTGLNDRYDIRNITFGGNKFVAVGVWSNVVVNGQITSWGRIISSSDGINWTSSNPENFDSTKISDMIYGNGKFIAFTSTGQIIYSSDGSTWIAVPNIIGTAISGIAYGAGKFVAVSNSSNKIAYSLDGITWSALITSPFNGIVYGDNNFMAWGNGFVACSSDGTTWMPLVNNSFSGIVYGAGKFVSWSWNNISYSTDGGITWMQVDSTLNDDGIINCMTYGNGIFIAAGRGGIAYSNKQE